MGATCSAAAKSCSATTTRTALVRDKTGTGHDGIPAASAETRLDEEALMASKWGQGSDNWGSIEALVNAPLQDVEWASSWLAVLLFYVFFPINVFVGVIAGLVQVCYVWVSNIVVFTVQRGKPCYMLWIWWSYAVASLTALVANSRSRLGLFMWLKAAFGNGDYFWQSEGIWATSWATCEKILQSQQMRRQAFGCIKAPVPDAFPPKLLIFLPNIGHDSEWQAIRDALHRTFLTSGSTSYQTRLKALPGKIAEDWPQVKLSNLTEDKARLQRLVVKCIFWMMMGGEWLSDSDAAILTGWRTNASFFILPRFVQRLAFNFGINKIKQLRIDTVKIIERRRMQDLFFEMNNALPPRFRRDTVVQLCDEIMYAVGFAGIGGTSAMCETAAAFLQKQLPDEFPSGQVDFEQFDSKAKMIEAYKKDNRSYLKECCRIDPPVTSATSVLKENQDIILGGVWKEFQAGTLRQYTLSLANRDEKTFMEPKVFNPFRSDLNQALTWNGAYGASGDEKTYPRICPGRYLSLDVATAIFDLVVNNEPVPKNGLQMHSLTTQS